MTLEAMTECLSCNGLKVVMDPQHGMSLRCERCSGKVEEKGAPEEREDDLGALRRVLDLARNPTALEKAQAQVAFLRVASRLRALERRNKELAALVLRMRRRFLNVSGCDMEPLSLGELEDIESVRKEYGDA